MTKGFIYLKTNNVVCKKKPKIKTQNYFNTYVYGKNQSMHLGHFKFCKEEEITTYNFLGILALPPVCNMNEVYLPFTIKASGFYKSL